MDTIRNFMNNLLGAYQDNRVYVITWVSMSSKGSSDEVEQVRNRLFGSEQQLSREEGPRRGRSRNRTQIVGGRIFRSISEEEAEEQPDYGLPVIGKNRTVTAVIRFKYYKFIGDVLKK